MIQKNQNKHIDEMIIHYLSGNANDKESEFVKQWTTQNDENKDRFEQIKKIWIHSGSVQFLQSIDVDGRWTKVKSKTGIDNQMKRISQKENEKSWLYQFTKIAAVFLLFIVTAYFLNQYYKNSTSSGSLIHSAEERISEFSLPDGTKLFLNKGSRIIYPGKFSRKERVVELEGEAFFEVVENQKKPFIVALEGNNAVKVLGTSFNIRVEPDRDAIIVHVISGKVSLYNRDDEERGIILLKDEKGIYSEGQFKKTGIEDMNFLSWKSGEIVFNNTPLDKVIRKISRQYKKEILLEVQDKSSILFTSTFRNQSFEEVIDEIVLVLGIQVRYQNDTIILFE